MARGKSRDDGTVLVRIRRMGSQWATCGIGVYPPKDRVRDPRMKALCPKLVPGQCRRLPADHPILRRANAKLVEIVSAPEPDEFECPWVFETVEDAVRANPSKSHLTADQIAEGLALTEGAQFNQKKKVEDRQRAAREVYEDETPVKLRGEKGRVQDELEDDGEDELEDDGDGLTEDVNAKRSQNRHVREDDDEKPAEDEEAPRPRRARRPGRASRS